MSSAVGMHSGPLRPMQVGGPTGICAVGEGWPSAGHST